MNQPTDTVLRCLNENPALKAAAAERVNMTYGNAIDAAAHRTHDTELAGDVARMEAAADLEDWIEDYENGDPARDIHDALIATILAMIDWEAIAASLLAPPTKEG